MGVTNFIRSHHLCKVWLRWDDRMVDRHLSTLQSTASYDLLYDTTCIFLQHFHCAVLLVWILVRNVMWWADGIFDLNHHFICAVQYEGVRTPNALVFCLLCRTHPLFCSSLWPASWCCCINCAKQSSQMHSTALVGEHNQDLCKYLTGCIHVFTCVWLCLIDSTWSCCHASVYMMSHSAHSDSWTYAFVIFATWCNNFA